MASFVASHAATYSDSHEDTATVGWRLAVRDTSPDPSEKQYLPMLRQVSKQFAQSESV